jgi:hypothetical protein
MNNQSVMLEDLREELWREVREHQEADHRLVHRIIFWEARSNEPRSFRDAFTDQEILKLAGLECVYATWPVHDRDWLIATVDAIYTEKEQI